MAEGCLLLVCLSRSFVVLNPVVRRHPGTVHVNGFVCRKSCFLRYISFHSATEFEEPYFISDCVLTGLWHVGQTSLDELDDEEVA
jgi:hypothetical protein